jgi:hypothetical protein
LLAQPKAFASVATNDIAKTQFAGSHCTTKAVSARYNFRPADCKSMDLAPYLAGLMPSQ